MQNQTNTNDVKDLTFEDALGELESIVRTLESGQEKLENAIHSYERGIALRTHCDAKLKEAQAKIEKITVNNDGSLATTPLDAGE